MGMSASQARYLALTERMNDIEYQGQQINQQRTTLSDQVNALYNSLLVMEVPTPPSTADYTKVVYTGKIGASNFEIGNVVPVNQEYDVELIYEKVGHYVESVGTAIITTDEDGKKSIKGASSPLMTLNEAVTNGAIKQESLENYQEALYNAHLELGETKEDVANQFYVYFTTNENQKTENIHFILIEDVNSNMPDSTGNSRAEYSDYLSNGTYTSTQEEKGCLLEFDVDGRITSISIPVRDKNGEVVSYKDVKLEASTKTDDLAYEEAYNQYEYQKHLYDKEQQKINAQTSVIQSQDKKLELKLTRLDNERNAVNTELEAVKKVIQDNIEKSFKTFSG